MLESVALSVASELGPRLLSLIYAKLLTYSLIVNIIVRLSLIVNHLDGMD
jgi:hypothetical protein